MNKGSIIILIFTAFLLLSCNKSSNETNTSTNVQLDELLLQTKANMESIKNYEHKFTIESEIEMAELLQFVSQYDKLDEANGIEKFIRDDGSYVYIEHNNEKMTSYSQYMDLWQVKDYNQDLYNQLLKFNKTIDIEGLFNSNYRLINTINGVSTYEFDGNPSDLLYMSQFINKTQFLEAFQVTEDQLNEIFKNNTYIVKIDNLKKLIISVEVDLTYEINEIVNIYINPPFRHKKFIIKSNFSKYNEIDLNITEEMRNGIKVDN